MPDLQEQYDRLKAELDETNQKSDANAVAFRNMMAAFETASKEAAQLRLNLAASQKLLTEKNAAMAPLLKLFADQLTLIQTAIAIGN